MVQQGLSVFGDRHFSPFPRLPSAIGYPRLTGGLNHGESEGFADLSEIGCGHHQSIVGSANRTPPEGALTSPRANRPWLVSSNRKLCKNGISRAGNPSMASCTVAKSCRSSAANGACSVKSAPVSVSRTVTRSLKLPSRPVAGRPLGFMRLTDTAHVMQICPASFFEASADR